MPNKAFHHIIAIKIGKLAEIVKSRKKHVCYDISKLDAHFYHGTKISHRLCKTRSMKSAVFIF